MTAIIDLLQRTRTISFDCYGTLIDWRTGFMQSCRELLGDEAVAQATGLFEVYVQLEAEVEAEVYGSYRKVLTITAERLARRLGVDLPLERAGLLAKTLPNWPVFSDTNEALLRLKRRYRLGVLSNIDRDLFARTARKFDVVFDFVIAAEDVRSYKPALPHFERLLARHGERETTLHLAQSLYHDGAPAGELGLAYVWINRYGEVNNTQVRPVAEFADLKSFAEVACGRE